MSTLALSSIVTQAVAIQDLLSTLLRQQPGNSLINTALLFALQIEGSSEELLISAFEGGV